MPIDLRKQGHVAAITIDNERRRNALNLAMWRAIPEAIADASADPNIRVVVLAGAGPLAFSAGADISEFATVRSTPDDVAAYEHAVEAALEAVASCPKPTIAAIRGICFGGGFELALACDLRIAEAGARFRMPGTRLGLGYAYSAVEMFVARLGPAATAEILFTGEAFDAAAALRLAVVQQVHAADAFEAARGALLETIASNAPLTLVAAKRALIELSRPHGERNKAAVDALVAACFASPDYAEGRAAFAEKRPPLFKAAAGTAEIRVQSDPGAKKVTP